MKRSTLLLFISFALSGCGGGDLACAPFTYQEEAQASYSKELDKNNNGIACETLPHRPARPSTPVPNPAPVTVIKSLNFTDALSRNPSVRVLSNGYYAYSVSAFYNSTPEFEDIGFVDYQGTVSLNTSGFKYFKVSGDSYLARISQGGIETQAVGYESGLNIPLTSISGSYNLLGQKCKTDNSRCEIVYGTAKINLSGEFKICPKNNYSESCPGVISLSISDTRSTPGVFLINYENIKSGSLLTGSDKKNGISLSLKTGNSVYAMFGHLTEYSAELPASGYTLASLKYFTHSQKIKYDPAVIYNSPVKGFSTNNKNDIFLNSNTGLLITGTTPALAEIPVELSFGKIMP
ncbi:MAG: hypothetical protein ACRCU9_12310 [Iodobacter sp.]